MTARLVVAPEARTKPGMMPSLINPAWSPGTPSVVGWYAEVEVDGATFQVSQLPGETEWTVDAAFAPGSSCPAFMNGFGARYLRTKVLTPEVSAVIPTPAAPEQCDAHQLPGGHTCTALCTTNCYCKEGSVTRKPFAPKPFEPGATVTWRHVTPYGSVEVEGVVVCDAPQVAGQRTMWVAPTTEGFSEVYSMVPVVRVARAGWRLTWLFNEGRTVKGEYVSSNVNGTEPLAMMVAAWRHGQQVKESNEQEWQVAA